jgi:hypothetical protein
MAHAPQKSGPPDAITIELEEDGAVRDVPGWCAHFACTPEELRAAVGEVGPATTDVEALLRRLGWMHR